MPTAVPGGFEDPEQAGTSEDADAERRHDAGIGEDLLDDAEDDDERVEAVEHGDEVALQADRVHLDEHLDREQTDEEQVRYLCSTNQRHSSLSAPISRTRVNSRDKLPVLDHFRFRSRDRRHFV